MTPVIMLTAVGEKDQVRRAALSHVTAYLLKPIANQALLEKIAQVLQLKPENIFDKKQYPLVINVTELSISQKTSRTNVSSSLTDSFLLMAQINSPSC